MPKNIAATRPVNPPGAEPKITVDQLWKGLELKVKQPELFLPVAASAELTSEGEKTIRSMTLKDGKVIRESLDLYKGTMVYFDTVDSSFRITNLISYDQNNELLLTYSFVNGVPGFPGMGAENTAEEINEIIGGVVDKSVAVIRDLVKKGSL